MSPQADAAVRDFALSNDLAAIKKIWREIGWSDSQCVEKATELCCAVGHASVVHGLSLVQKLTVHELAMAAVRGRVTSGRLFCGNIESIAMGCNSSVQFMCYRQHARRRAIAAGIRSNIHRAPPSILGLLTGITKHHARKRLSKLNNETILRTLGWKSSFTDLRGAHLAEPNRSLHRVTEVQRTGLIVAPLLEDGRSDVPVGGKWFQRPERERPTVGDWVILDSTDGRLVELLPRTSLLTRLSPAGNGTVQLIAANVDSAFVVTSCNADFNIPRLQRYVSAILEAGIEPVIVLTKIDQTSDAETYQTELRAAFPTVISCAVNALNPQSVADLNPWCAEGQTIALLGSSGVGKSTLVNTLMGGEVQRTQAIREEDGKGRHTTTYRSAHLLPQGAVILDSPGMREFQMADANAGVAELFDDIEALAQACRFRDCAHNAEPGCAVQAAIARGQLDPRRLASYNKLRGQ